MLKRKQILVFKSSSSTYYYQSTVTSTVKSFAINYSIFMILSKNFKNSDLKMKKISFAFDNESTYSIKR